MKTILYQGSIIKVFAHEFEIWRDGNMIAEFIYNTKKPLMRQIKEALEM